MRHCPTRYFIQLKKEKNEKPANGETFIQDFRMTSNFKNYVNQYYLSIPIYLLVISTTIISMGLLLFKMYIKSFDQYLYLILMIMFVKNLLFIIFLVIIQSMDSDIPYILVLMEFLYCLVYVFYIVEIFVTIFEFIREIRRYLIKNIKFKKFGDGKYNENGFE
jgi:hypothetical protein